MDQLTPSTLRGLKAAKMVPVYLLCQKVQKVTQKNTASRQAVTKLMPDLFPSPWLPIKGWVWDLRNASRF